MEGLWTHMQELKESINGGIEPMDTVKLPTSVVKKGLGLYLFQAFVMAMWWSIKDGVFYPWLFFISTFLQIGWFWNKVTDSWKEALGFRYVRMNNPDIEDPPSINVQTGGITGLGNSVDIPFSSLDSSITLNDSTE